MEMMKALVLAGKDEKIEVREIPRPIVQAGQMLVRIKAAALNRRDEWICQGKYAGIVYPTVLGSDGAGVVEQVGEGVDSSWIGKDVVLDPSFNWGTDPRAQSTKFAILGMPSQGTLAEYVTIDATHVHAKPHHLDYKQSASLPVAGVTAYRAVAVQAAMQPNKAVLVTGIGGGVALFILQFAKALGARVFVSSTQEQKIVQATRLGALGGVCTSDATWLKQLQKEVPDLEYVFDSIGGELVNPLLQALVPGGCFVSYGATLGAVANFEIRRIFWKQLRMIGSTMGTAEDFKAMLELVSTHAIVPQVDSVFALEQARDAFARIRESGQFGKIVVNID